MNFTIFKQTAAIITVTAGLLSCSKWVDLKPSDTIDPTKAFRNMNDLDMGLLGAYAALDYTLISTSAIVSDEVLLPGENTFGNTDAHRWNYTPSVGSVTAAFGEYYIVIDRANRILANIDNVATGDQALKDRYRGEALALRAFSHFELLRGYASAYEPGALGVPYMLESQITQPARNSFEDVIAKTKDDLINAKALIPSAFNDKSRISKATISAIQARVALYEKNWAEAVTYSTEAIAALPLATKTQFPNIWPDKADAKVFWKLKRVLGDTRLGSVYYREAERAALYAPSFKLVNQFDKVNDIRYNAYIMDNPSTVPAKTPYAVAKYVGGNLAAPGLVDIKLFRTGEMYLIRAEAYAETTGKLADGARDLSDLRAARINGYTDETLASKEELITAVYTERFKELAFEGHRFFDLKRRNLPVQRLPEDATFAFGAVLLQPTQAQYAFPIPAREMLVNKNPGMVQNPKYNQ